MWRGLKFGYLLADIWGCPSNMMLGGQSKIYYECIVFLVLHELLNVGLSTWVWPP